METSYGAVVRCLNCKAVGRCNGNNAGTRCNQKSQNALKQARQWITLLIEGESETVEALANNLDDTY